MFGDNNYWEWAELLQEYAPPPYTPPGHTPVLSFGVAGPGSGVPFHRHGYLGHDIMRTCFPKLSVF